MDIVETPKRGRPPRAPAEYEAQLLDYYATKGNLRMAAKVAGVGLNTVARRAKADAAFRARLRSARKDFIARLEERLVDMGMQGNNVVAVLARLNATGTKTARRYVQRAVEQSVTNIYNDNRATVISEDAARRLLSVSLGQITPATQRMLQGAGAAPEDAVIDAAPGGENAP